MNLVSFTILAHLSLAAGSPEVQSTTELTTPHARVTVTRSLRSSCYVVWFGSVQHHCSLNYFVCVLIISIHLRIVANVEQRMIDLQKWIT
jgi:hypothetical protein